MRVGVVAAGGGRWRVAGVEGSRDDAGLAEEVRRREAGRPRWVWEDTSRVYPVLLRAGVPVARCHDVGFTADLLAGHAGEPVHGRAVPEPDAQPALFGTEPEDPLTLEELTATDEAQQEGVRAAQAVSPGFGLLVAAESAVALAAVELGAAGLPWNAAVHDAVLEEALGPRPRHGGRPPKLQALAEEVIAALGAPGLHLDSQPAVLSALKRAGIPVETLRAHELRKHEHPAIGPLLRYKELSRLHVAHGWAWRDQWVRDGRFRATYVPGGVVSGRWATSGGGALQIPRAVRSAVVAEPGRVLVLADAGQVEPRVLAAMAGDPAMAAATREGDLYAAIAAQLGRERDVAKVAMLSAMYGGGAGSALPALQELRRRFPRALALLEDAARTGEDGGTVRSVLGRTCPPPRPGWQDAEDAVASARARARGRFTRNFVVQASAADWANVLIAVLRTRLTTLAPAELVFFQHDEVVVHAPRELAEAVVEAIAEAGAEATRLVLGDHGVQVPLKAVIADSYGEKA